MAKTKLKKFHVTGSYTQYFECFVYAETEEEAYAEALSGDADYMDCDCDDWFVDEVEEVKE